MDDAKSVCHQNNKSPSEQIEHWAHIGKYAESNPGFPYSVIKAILDADW